MGWDLLDDDTQPAEDPADEPWSASDDEDATWEDDPLVPEEAPDEDWALPGEGAEEFAETESRPLSPGPTLEDWAQESTEPEPEGWQGETDGPVVVGWSERASLPTWGIQRLPTRCSTDQEMSSLYVELRPGLPGRVTLVLGEQTVDVGVGERGDDLVARTRIKLVGLEFEATLRICGTSGPPHMVIGRDVLAGRFLVDPSLSWTQRSSA